MNTKRFQSVLKDIQIKRQQGRLKHKDERNFILKTDLLKRAKQEIVDAINYALYANIKASPVEKNTEDQINDVWDLALSFGKPETFYLNILRRLILLYVFYFETEGFNESMRKLFGEAKESRKAAHKKYGTEDTFWKRDMNKEISEELQDSINYVFYFAIQNKIGPGKKGATKFIEAKIKEFTEAVYEYSHPSIIHHMVSILLDIKTRT